MLGPVYYITKTIQHIRAGTLQKRIERFKTERRQACLGRWWDVQAQTREYMDSEVEPGVRLRLYFDSAIAKDIHCHEHEVGERSFARLFLKPGDVFVDIGANMGLYSIIASQSVGESGAVFSFEPDPKVYARLQHNLRENGCQNVQTFQLALSNTDETRSMQISASGFDAYNSFGTPVRGEGTFLSREVECVSFDSFASRAERLNAVTMMKVDVEGWETMVLKGAERHLGATNAPMLQVEFNDQAAKALNQPCSELYLWLQSLGYSIYTFDARSCRLVPHPYRDHYVYDNVYAIKDLAHVTSRLEKDAHS